ncbi:hypothetical protein [Microvirga makkahensis]|uniref:hypothetical protein n=1 Tax=Microvirga makkahensis TaxID=1128670 RepID=UPI00197BCDD0|nr:hypothetical protein [Microvirga makkahensis]
MTAADHEKLPVLADAAPPNMPELAEELDRAHVRKPAVAEHPPARGGDAPLQALVIGRQAAVPSRKPTRTLRSQDPMFPAS